MTRRSAGPPAWRLRRGEQGELVLERHGEGVDLDLGRVRARRGLLRERAATRQPQHAAGPRRPRSPGRGHPPRGGTLAAARSGEAPGPADPHPHAKALLSALCASSTWPLRVSRRSRRRNGRSGLVPAVIGAASRDGIHQVGQDLPRRRRAYRGFWRWGGSGQVRDRTGPPPERILPVGSLGRSPSERGYALDRHRFARGRGLRAARVQRARGRDGLHPPNAGRGGLFGRTGGLACGARVGAAPRRPRERSSRRGDALGRHLGPGAAGDLRRRRLPGRLAV